LYSSAIEPSTASSLCGYPTPSVPRNPRRRRLSRILRVRFQQKTSGHLEYGGDFTAGLPRVAAENSKAHASLFIIGHVRVVDFSLERQNRRLEWVVVGKRQKQLECSALCVVVKLSFSERRTPGGVNERRMESPWDP
jgi:hypothetical protein